MKAPTGGEKRQIRQMVAPEACWAQKFILLRMAWEIRWSYFSHKIQIRGSNVLEGHAYGARAAHGSAV